MQTLAGMLAHHNQAQGSGPVGLGEKRKEKHFLEMFFFSLLTQGFASNYPT
jgi:hypothetical protein